MDKPVVLRNSRFISNSNIPYLGEEAPISPTEAWENFLIMEDRDLEYFRKVLTQSLKDLLKKGNETVSFLLTSTVEASDPLDKATFEADRSFRFRIRDRENKLIRKIEQALSRIEDGSFGVCEMCGEEISLKRLKARPVTTYCIACKNKMEEMEKAVGV